MSVFNMHANIMLHCTDNYRKVHLVTTLVAFHKVL